MSVISLAKQNQGWEDAVTSSRYTCQKKEKELLKEKDNASIKQICCGNVEDISKNQWSSETNGQ